MKNIRIHIIQHVSFETPALIEEWANDNNHKLTFSRLYINQGYPELREFDFLIIMGGPVSVYEQDEDESMKNEKSFILKCIGSGKTVLGICLGAQLIAAVLGAKVYKGPYKEIGWFPVTFINGLFPEISPSPLVFHWHGDTFDIPEGGIPIAKSAGVPNQGFIYNNKIMALQFHLEMNAAAIGNMLLNCSTELLPGKYIQTADQIRQGIKHINNAKHILFYLLNYLSERINR